MPYTHKKVGTKFVVYKKGKKVGETAEVVAPAGTLNFRIDSITAG